MPRIKGIFFDAAGVFYEREKTTNTYAAELLAGLGYSAQLSESALARKNEIRVLATEGRINHENYWDELLKMYGVDAADQRQELKRRILDHTHRVSAYPQARLTMTTLKQRGFVLGIVTDTIYPLEWKMNWLAQVGVADLIDVVSCSTVLGSHKPDPLMYLNAVKQARLTPDESAFVGHDTGELEGAKRAGLATVAVNYDPQAIADYYAYTLADLLNVPIFDEATVK